MNKSEVFLATSLPGDLHLSPVTMVTAGDGVVFRRWVVNSKNYRFFNRVLRWPSHKNLMPAQRTILKLGVARTQWAQISNCTIRFCSQEWLSPDLTTVTWYWNNNYLHCHVTTVQLIFMLYKSYYLYKNKQTFSKFTFFFTVWMTNFR